MDGKTVFEYIGQVFSWMRLCLIEDPNGGFDRPEYWIKKVLVFDSLEEC